MLDDFAFGVEDLIHYLFRAPAQSVAVPVQHLKRLIATLGDAGNQELQVFVECDAFLESQVVGKFARRAAENLVDFDIHL